MKRVIIAILIVVGILLFLGTLGVNAPRKPPLRTWELETMINGKGNLEASFTTPSRDCHYSYWSFKVGLVVPSDQEFHLSGKIVVTSGDKRRSCTLTFDPESVTNSSWLQDDNRISYLLGDDFGMRDEKRYHLELYLDSPVPSDVAVVLHFLSQTAPKPITSEQGGAEQPAITSESKPEGEKKPTLDVRLGKCLALEVLGLVRA